MAEIFYLDWNKHTLFGWETVKSDLVVDAIVRGIEAGDEFPPVHVHQGEKGYYLSPLRETSHGWTDGGHNRAVGHYIARQPLKCMLMRGGPIFPETLCVPIPEIILEDDRGQYQERREVFGQYR